MARRFGGIEAGGTKFVCAVGTGPDDIGANMVRFDTTTPEETVGEAIDFFQSYPDLAAIGIGSFGPVDLKRGRITTTPKTAWQDFDFVTAIRRGCGGPDMPVAFDTDVNAAALAEGRWGAAQGLDTFIYLTVGTGIGGGGMVNGGPMHGLVHPEMGHLRIPRRPDDQYLGRCPYHRDCLEGLAAGPAIRERWGRPAEDLRPSHPAWGLEAHYLGLGIANLILSISPQRVVLGGGVMEQEWLYAQVRAKVREVLNDYVAHEAIRDPEQIDGYIVPPGMADPGVVGAIALAEEAAGRAGR